MANVQNNVRFGDLTAYPLATLGERGKGFDERTLEREYIDVLTGFHLRLPAQFSEHPDDADMELLSYDYEVIAHDRVSVRLFYVLKPVTDWTTPPPIPPDQISHTGSTMMEVLQRFPGYETTPVPGAGKTLAQLWDKELGMIGKDAPEDLRGASGYYIGSFQTTVTRFGTAKLSPSLSALVGERHVPPGGGGAVRNWLVLTGSEKEPSPGSPWYTQTVVYQFSDLGFPDFIYG